jgi:hypothetical protein
MKKKIFTLAVLSICLLLVVSLSFSAKDTKAPPSKEKETMVTENRKAPDRKEDTKTKGEIIHPTQLPQKNEQPPVHISPVQPEQMQATPVPAPKTAGYQLKWKALSSAGINGSSASYKMRGTVAESFVGKGSSSFYRLKVGYWAGVAEFSEVTYLKGDANGDKKTSVSDVVFLINFLFKGGSPPLCPPSPYLVCGDVNCDGKVSVSDVVYLINYLFKGGPPPGDPDRDGTPEC